MRRVRHGCGRLAVVLWAAAIFAQPAEWDRLNGQAQELFARGEYEKGEAIARRALEVAEKHTSAGSEERAVSLFNLAEFARALGRLEAADGHYRAALAIARKLYGPDDPGVAAILNGLAGNHAALGRAAEAEAAWREALAIDERALGATHPLVARDLNNLGSFFEQQGRHGDAEAFYRRALDLLEASSEAEPVHRIYTRLNLAGLLRVRGRAHEAETEARTALALAEPLGSEHPLRSVCLRTLAAAQRDLGDIAGARTSLEAASRIVRAQLTADDPERKALEAELAELAPSRTRQGAPAPAASAGTPPRDAVRLFELGVAYDKQLRYREAIDTFRRVVELDPGHRRAYQYLALLYEFEQDLGRAEEAYRQAIALERNNPAGDEWPFLNYGILLSKSGRTEEALEHLRRARTVNPRSAKAAYEAGRVLLQAGEPEQAAAALEEALALDASMGRAHYFLGHAYQKLEQPEKARKEWEAFARMGPGSSVEGPLKPRGY